MSRPVIIAVTIVAGAAALVIAGWYDGTLMVEARRRAAATFDSSQLVVLQAVGSFLVAAAVLALPALAWRARSAAVSIVYLVAGVVMTLLMLDPFAGMPGELSPVAGGPLNAVLTVAAAMAIIGLVTGIRWAMRSAPGRAAASGLGQ